MTTVVVVRSEAPREIASLSSTGEVLDLSIACKSVRERIEGALGGRYNIVYSDIKSLVGSIRRIEDDIVILLDPLSLYTDLRTVIDDAVREYASQASDILVATSPPIIARGVNVAVEDSRLAGLGGGFVFAGIVVARRSRLERLAADEWRTLLEELEGATVYYVKHPWVRLEKGYDILLYLILLLASMRSQTISSEANISPTAVIEGPVYIEEGVRIDHYAVIKGPAVICRNAFVGLHATVRSFTSLEPGARIGAYSEAYVAYIGRNASISSHVYITGSVVGEEAKIEPFTATKVVYGKTAAEKLGLVAPFPWEVRAGAVIESGARVTAGSVLQPLTRVTR